jgi:hypothetical protein
MKIKEVRAAIGRRAVWFNGDRIWRTYHNGVITAASGHNVWIDDNPKWLPDMLGFRILPAEDEPAVAVVRDLWQAAEKLPPDVHSDNLFERKEEKSLCLSFFKILHLDCMLCSAVAQRVLRAKRPADVNDVRLLWNTPGHPVREGQLRSGVEPDFKEDGWIEQQWKDKHE